MSHDGAEKTKKVEELEKELQATRQELEEKVKQLEAMQSQTLRFQADFENARKRSLKAQAELQELANGDLLRQLLDIFDDFQRALSLEVSTQKMETFRAGVDLIAQRMEEFLKSYGVLPMEAVGQLFDPTLHEAVAHEATDKVPESTVLEELRRGYTMNGRVLRPAVVKVAVKPEHQEEKQETGSSDLSLKKEKT